MSSQTTFRSTSVGDVEERVEAPVPAGRPILVVDDEPSARLVIAAGLAELGLLNPTVEVGDGEAAMAMLQRGIDGGDDQLPALVLLDLRLPGCSGQDVFGWMRDTSELAQIPVIVLTGDDDAETVTSLYRLGVRSYLVKPVGFAALASVIRDLDLPWMLT